jgi:hypothetical protein
MVRDLHSNYFRGLAIMSVMRLRGVTRERAMQRPTPHGTDTAQRAGFVDRHCDRHCDSFSTEVAPGSDHAGNRDKCTGKGPNTHAGDVTGSIQLSQRREKK